MLLSQESETLTIAGLTKYPDAYWTINDIGLTSRDFMLPMAKKVMQSLTALVGDRKTPQMPLLIEAVANDDEVLTYLEALNKVSVSLPQAIESAKIVKGLSTSRHLASVGAAIINLSEEHRANSDEAVAAAEGLLRTVRAELPVPDRSPNPADILARLNDLKDTRSTRIQFSPTLDGMVSGMQPGHLWVIGGFSSTGKSAAVANFAIDALRARKWTGIFSLEMTQEQFLVRLLSVATNVSQSDIKNRAFFGQEDVDKMRKTEAWFMSAPLRIYDTSYRLTDIRSKAIQMKETVGLDLFVVDFIQNVHVNGDEFADARATILELQNMAKELDCTVMALSQVSNAEGFRQQDGSKDTGFYSFKGHGSIRDAADVAVMLKRDRLHSPGIMDFNVVKHRHGEFGNIPMNFDMRTGRLTDNYDLVQGDDDD